MKIDYEYLPLSKIKIDIHNQCYSQNYAHGKRAIDAAPDKHACRNNCFTIYPA
mgnify:CR=1 FL=1